MQTIQDLMGDLPSSEGAFAERYPDPALVVDPRSELGGALLVDTPSKPVVDETRPGHTEILGPLQAAKELTRIGAAVDPRATVAWLAKSDRNPFGSLITVGRARNNDVVFGESTVSKLHAIFTCPDGRNWLVEDDHSSNGTFLNGMRLTPKEKVPVSDGDSLRLGPDILVRFFLPDSLWQYLQLLRA